MDALHAERHIPWNKGKLTGQKPPLKLREIWGIRIRLQLTRNARELALFNLAIDSKLRGCDLLRLRVLDISHQGGVMHRATVVQRKTGRPVQFELTDQTRQSVTAWLRHAHRVAADYLFPSRRRRQGHLSTRQYARLVQGWVASIGLDPATLRYALTATYQADPDLPPDQEPPGRPTALGPHQAGEHRPLSRNLARGRHGDCGRDGCLAQ